MKIKKIIQINFNNLSEFKTEKNLLSSNEESSDENGRLSRKWKRNLSRQWWRSAQSPEQKVTDPPTSNRSKPANKDSSGAVSPVKATTSEAFRRKDLKASSSESQKADKKT